MPLRRPRPGRVALLLALTTLAGAALLVLLTQDEWDTAASDLTEQALASDEEEDPTTAPTLDADSGYRDADESEYEYEDEDPAEPPLTSPSLTRTPSRSWLRLLAYLRRRPFLVAQTDNRVAGALDSPGRRPLGNFSASTTAVSTWAMQRWAEEQGGAYLLHASPMRECLGPRLETGFAPYWCKVPTIIYAIELCRAADVPYVLYLDSDVFPGDPALTFQRALVRDVFEADPNVTFAVSPDAQFWRGVIEDGFRIYNQRAINSGAIAVRVGTRAAAIARSWWFNMTLLRSPYETLWSELRLRVGAPLLPAFNTTAQVERGLRAALNSSALLVDAVARDEDDPDTLLIVVKPNALVDGAIPQWRDVVVPGCCSSDACARAAVNASLEEPTPPFQCEVQFADAKRGWPGDQDSLNWLTELLPRDFVVVDHLSSGCVRAEEPPASERRDQLVQHACFNPPQRAALTELEARLLMRRVRFLAPARERDFPRGAVNPARGLKRGVLKRRAARWDADAWPLWRAVVRSYTLPRAAYTTLTVDVVASDVLLVDDRVVLRNVAR